MGLFDAVPTNDKGNLDLMGLTSLLGPYGQALGFVANMVPGLDGFLQSGFDFTCLGSQAFDKANLDNCLNDLKKRADIAQQSQDLKKLGDLATFCDGVVKESAMEIAKYRSGCSKSLRQKYADSAQSVIATLDLTKFDVSTKTAHNWDGAQYQQNVYTAKIGGSYSASDFSKITPQMFESDIKPLIISKAKENGVNPSSLISSAFSSLFPNSPPYNSDMTQTNLAPPFDGALNIGTDQNGNIIWSASASNAPQNNLLIYIGVAIGALLLFKRKK